MTVKDKGLLGFINSNKPDQISEPKLKKSGNSLEPQLSESFCYYKIAKDLWQEIKK
jgi:hypothetical protein